MKIVNKKIRETSAQIRNLETKINEMTKKKRQLINDLTVLIAERHDIIEKQILLKQINK